MSKLGKAGHKCHFWNCLSRKKDKTCIVLSLTNEIEGKKCESSGVDAERV